MKKVIIGIALACGVCFSQGTSKLKGMKIYLHRKDAGDHTDGYVGLKNLLDTKKTVYGYTFESTAGSMGEVELNALYNRLYKAGGVKQTNTIDILIFCQGQGDQNVGGGSSTNPFGGATARYSQVSTHLKHGGALILVHAAAGREISWQNWVFGATLMGDWFVDAYYASSSIAGNGGHFSYGTPGTYTLDDETLPAKDSSTYFIRKLFTTAKTSNGLGQAAISPTVKGEWYHFNGGKKFEDGTGGAATHPNNKIPGLPTAIRGNMGNPDSGIGPAKVTGALSKIENYTPTVPGGKRPGVWVREVSNGKFDASKKKENGRFMYFNPGHAAEEFTDAGGWMGDLFLANLRWVAKDDLGCTDSKGKNFNAQASLSDGSCDFGTGIQDAILDDGEINLGRISTKASGMTVEISKAGAHLVSVTNLEGRVVFQRSGTIPTSYSIPGLQRGFYLVSVNGSGKRFLKKVGIL